MVQVVCTALEPFLGGQLTTVNFRVRKAFCEREQQLLSLLFRGLFGEPLHRRCEHRRIDLFAIARNQRVVQFVDEPHCKERAGVDRFDGSTGP